MPAEPVGRAVAGGCHRPILKSFRFNTSPVTMFSNLTPFLLHWGITAMSLWVASHLFSGVKFDGLSSLLVSALLLGFANAIIKPLLVVLTLPLTLLTFGLFVLVINALMILLAAKNISHYNWAMF